MVNQVTIAWIALGSNVTSPLGSPAQSVLAAIQRVQNDSCEIFLKSRLFLTPAMPEGSGPDFVNACIGVRFSGDAEALLHHLHTIEHALGRARNLRWGPRVIDLDLLAFGDTVLPDPATHAAWRNLPFEAQMIQTPEQLIVPHPRLQDRAFVLIPLNDIAPDWMHPILGKTVSQMLAAVPEAEKTAVSPLE